VGAVLQRPLGPRRPNMDVAPVMSQLFVMNPTQPAATLRYLALRDLLGLRDRAMSLLSRADGIEWHLLVRAVAPTDDR
jgi:hypothetical protein